MSLLSRIAKRAAAASGANPAPGRAGAGSMLKVGDLVHAAPAPQLTAGEPESGSSDLVESARAESIVASSPAARSTFADAALPPVQSQSTALRTAAVEPAHSAAALPQPVNGAAPTAHAERIAQLRVPDLVEAPVTAARQPALVVEPALANLAPTATTMDLAVLRDAAGVAERVSAASHLIAPSPPAQASQPLRHTATQRTTPAANNRAEVLPVQQMAASIDQPAPSIAQPMAAGSALQPTMVTPAAALPQRAVAAVSSAHVSSQRTAPLVAPPSAPLQPRVHIGSLEVIVEAPPAAAPQQAAPLRGASFASRHYLRGL